MFVFHLCTCMLGAFLFCFGVHDHLLYLVLMFCSHPIMPTCFSLSKQHVDVLCANQWTLCRKCILPWFSGYLLVIRVCNFANRLGRPIYLLGDLSVYSMKTNSSNTGQMKTVPKAKKRVCLCFFDRAGEEKRKPKTGTEMGNYSTSAS